MKLIVYLLVVIAACQVIQTIHYITSSAEAGSVMPVIIEGISPRAANDSHALPVKVREPIKWGRE